MCFLIESREVVAQNNCTSEWSFWKQRDQEARCRICVVCLSEQAATHSKARCMALVLILRDWLWIIANRTEDVISCRASYDAVWLLDRLLASFISGQNFITDYGEAQSNRWKCILHVVQLGSFDTSLLHCGYIHIERFLANNSSCMHCFCQTRCNRHRDA